MGAAAARLLVLGLLALQEGDGEHEVQVVRVSRNVVHARVHELDLALELLQAGPLDKLDRLGEGVGELVGGGVEGGALVHRVAKGEDVLHSRGGCLAAGGAIVTPRWELVLALKY